jgi:hypothetical protein
VRVEDVATNVDADTDDSITLTPASPERVFQDAFAEVYYLDGFEDDTIHVTSNADVTLTVGIGSQVGPDWTITPPSLGPGEDFRELGTLFYAFVARDLTIFPTQDSTTVTITDLSDGDDTTTFTLGEGNLVGDYDLYVTDLWARNGTGLVPRASAPAVGLVTGGAAAPFENDLVRIESDRPILVYVGPKAADTNEYADVAYPVRTGPSDFLLYAYAQNGGAEDLQVFAYSATTNIRITSLSTTAGFRNNGQHDVLLPTVTPWLGGNAVTNDWYWASGFWNGELLRFESDAPMTIIDGDYDGPNFGCFIPFVADSGLLRPIADAGPDVSACPGQTSVTLDGSASFDADTTPGAAAPSWTWDTDPAVDRDGDGNATNDADLTGPVVTFFLVGPGPWTVTLTFTDDDGQSDTDVVVVEGRDAQAPVIDCPSDVPADADPATGSAFVPVLATVTDNCDPTPTVVNDRTAGGVDASDDYPCGVTTVEFVAVDDAGNASTCRTRVGVTDIAPPVLACPALLLADADAAGFAVVPVLATATDPCDPAPAVTNDRTAGGADATDSYACGETLVTFTARDASFNVSSCATRVVVADVTPPDVACAPLVSALPDSPLGATVPVSGSATDACDPAVAPANDRTAGGADATDFYPCGETLVTFGATDASGNAAVPCVTTVSVQPPSTPPAGISPALRASKVDGADPHSVVRFHWAAAPALLPWEHYEVRRTAVASSRPYPLLFVDPAFTAREHVDAAATGPLLFYQVYVADCAGRAAPGILDLSP